MDTKQLKWYNRPLFGVSSNANTSVNTIAANNVRHEEQQNSASLDSFKAHWDQAWSVMDRKVFSDITVDDITSIVTHVDQMVTLLLRENDEMLEKIASKSSNSLSPLLDYLFIESILDKLLNWSGMCGDWAHIMKLEQLKLYELLLSQVCRNDALFQQPLVRPLLNLLSQFVDTNSPVEVEKRLVVLLNTLCICLSQNIDLLEVFFQSDPSVSSHGETRFLVFSLLIPFIHREGAIGHQARDALLLCMALSRHNDLIGIYISEQSNFCLHLATGLSGLYSSLPRRLSNGAILSEDWHQITHDDIQENPDIENFLNSLEFCNAVTQLSHPMIKKEFLDYVYNGFLVPVIAPALHQNTLEEIIATTSYFDLFVRNVSEPNLLQVFLKFVCTEKYEDQKILDTLISRLNANSRLSLVTLVLFRTLLELNCEDLMLELVLKYLIPGRHLFGGKENYKTSINDLSSYSVSAQKFLLLIPSCCYTSQNYASHNDFVVVADNYDSLSHSSNGSDSVAITASVNDIKYLLINYLDYLKDAHIVVSKCIKATRSWSNRYDANSRVTAFSTTDTSNNTNICANNHEMLKNINGSQCEEETINCSLIGPFLNTLLSRLESLCENDVYTNLQLTGLLSRLALYPQPLLRSFLFNSKLVFQNDVKNFWTIISDLKNKFETDSSQITNFDDLLRKGRQFLRSREERLSSDKKVKQLPNAADGYPIGRKGSTVSIVSEMGDGNSQRKRMSIRNMFRSVTAKARSLSNASINPPPSRPMLEAMSGGQGYIYVNSRENDEIMNITDTEENLRIQKIVLAAIVFEEFLRELSAISYEHYILEYIDPFNLQSTSDQIPKLCQS